MEEYIPSLSVSVESSPPFFFACEFTKESDIPRLLRLCRGTVRTKIEQAGPAIDSTLPARPGDEPVS